MKLSNGNMRKGYILCLEYILPTSVPLFLVYFLNPPNFLKDGSLPYVHDGNLTDIEKIQIDFIHIFVYANELDYHRWHKNTKL